MARPAATTQSSSRKARAEESRRRLLAAAMEHFSERHYEDVAVGDIAESAGVAHGSLFHHFENKRGIYLAVMREAAHSLDVANEVDADLPPDEQIRQMFQAHLRYLVEHRGLALRLVLGGRGTDPEAWALFEEDRWRSIAWVCEILGLDPDAPALRLMLRSIVGAADEATVYWLENGEPFDTGPLVEALVDVTAAGLRAATRLDPSLEMEEAVARLRQAPRR